MAKFLSRQSLILKGRARTRAEKFRARSISTSDEVDGEWRFLIIGVEELFMADKVCSHDNTITKIRAILENSPSHS